MDLLDEANRLVSGDRQNDYGHPADDFERIARLYAPILEADIDPALKHALLMIQVKISRLLNTPDHIDSVIDIAGYAKCYGMILERKLDKA